MTPLVQIRRAYRARWNRLTFQLEAEEPQWSLRVLDADARRVLYSAARCNREAAENAGLEFARFHACAAIQAESAERLVWQEYW